MWVWGGTQRQGIRSWTVAQRRGAAAVSITSGSIHGNHNSVQPTALQYLQRLQWSFE